MVGLQMCGESTKVDENSVNLWLPNFIIVKNSYAPRDVFNMDKTGIFYTLMSNRTLHFKGERCHGSAKSKQRVTVVLCCNSDGSEKYKAWVIGKSHNPRCFKNVDKSHLPCDYTHHVSSWIDAQAFREWLLKLDQKMIAQHRHILLTLDNCAAHKTENLNLSNITVYFFPSNTTSRLQPLNQGITANLKSFYKAKLVKFAIENNGNVKWDLLQAIKALGSSWNAVNQQTIKRCFNKAWPNIVLTDDENLDLLPPAFHSFEDFVNADNDLAICPEPVLSTFEDSDNDIPVPATTSLSSVDSDEGNDHLQPTREEINAALRVLARFSATMNVSEQFKNCLETIATECAIKMASKLKQKNITDFFKVNNQ
ncbi:tigger transposable element-derived protein 6-like [Onthophagus taurus]|uniref:tigger transposable element-derived protein 6-like n=1 Tax=Onthophagus taurus TaxID=166361 RepID=UPI0039BDD0CC